MQTQGVIEILHTILEGHFEFLPEILKSRKKDLVQAALELMALLRTQKFDKVLEDVSFLKEHFQPSLALIRSKPETRYSKLLLKNIFDFNRNQQEEILTSLLHFSNSSDISRYLMKNVGKFHEVLKPLVMQLLIDLGQKEGIQYVLELVPELETGAQVEVLSHLRLAEVKFNTDQTRLITARVRDLSNVEEKAANLALLSKADQSLAFPLIMEHLTRQAEIVACASFEALIDLGKYDQITSSLLEQYASSRHFQLAKNVAIVYSKKYKAQNDEEDLKRGLNVLSYLLNESSRDAQLAAIQAASSFVGEPRVIDWIGSLLLSESDDQILDLVLDFLGQHQTDEVKQLLVKAVGRDIELIKVRALKLLAPYEDSSLFSFYHETLGKEQESPQICEAAIEAMSFAIPPEREEEYKALLVHENLEVQRAAILGLRNWFSDGLKNALERSYQDYAGMNRSLAAYILFRMGVPYILDDLYEMLSSEKPTEQKVSLVAVKMLYEYVKETPPERLSKEVLSNLEIWYREAEARFAKEDVLLDFDVSRVLSTRARVLNGEIDSVIEALEAQLEKQENFYLELALLYLKCKNREDIVPEQALKLISQASGCMISYQVLDQYYKTKKRKTEFLVNQLRMREAQHQYYAEILEILNGFSQEEMSSKVFVNLLKILQKGSLPANQELHHLFSQIYVKLKKYHKAYKHLTFCFLTNKENSYFVELASSCLKCGYWEKADQICIEGLKYCSKDEDIRSKLEALRKKIEGLKG